MNTKVEFLKGFQLKSALAAGIIGASIPLSWLMFLILVKSEIFESWMWVPLTFIPLGGVFGGLLFYLMGLVSFWSPKTGRNHLQHASLLCSNLAKCSFFIQPGWTLGLNNIAPQLTIIHHILCLTNHGKRNKPFNPGKISGLDFPVYQFKTLSNWFHCSATINSPSVDHRPN